MTTTLINCRQLKLENQTWSKQSARELHSSFKRLKPAKNKLTWCDFTNFSEQVSANSLVLRFRSFYALPFQSLLNCCQPKHNQSVSRILWISFLAYFCYLAQLCTSSAVPPPIWRKKNTRANKAALLLSCRPVELNTQWMKSFHISTIKKPNYSMLG